MRPWNTALLIFVVVAAVAAQSPEPPLSDSRLTVHTLLREDMFAGFMSNDMDRFSRGERNVEALVGQRPDQRGNLMAWKGAAALYRAVLAHESGNAAEFRRQFNIVRESYADASKHESGNDGVQAIIGGSLSIFADRLPQEHRAAAWSQAYDAYSALWKQQEPAVSQLPVHFRGELVAGLATAAQRTGRKEEQEKYVEMMLTMLKDTPYEATAQEWKANPASAATSKLTCKTCHNPGRLSSRLAALNQ
jgi:hypothetical protein